MTEAQQDEADRERENSPMWDDYRCSGCGEWRDSDHACEAEDGVEREAVAS